MGCGAGLGERRLTESTRPRIFAAHEQRGQGMSAGTGMPPTGSVASGTRLGDYVVGEPLWRVRVADAYFARGPEGAATLYVVVPSLSSHAEVRAEIVAGARAAAGLPDHPALVRTVAAGLTGDVLWIATEDVDGACLRDVLRKKLLSGQRGLGSPGAALVVRSAAAALLHVHHGALTSESIVASRSGRPRIADLALARGVLAASRLRLLPASVALAPEVDQGAPASVTTDIFGLGGLLYECLVGKPLERSGPRPSELVPSLPSQIDDVVARCCHREPARRFGNLDTLRELVDDLLGRGGEAAAPGLPAPPRRDDGLASRPSLASSLVASPGSIASSSGMVIAPRDTALAAALSDDTEKWLISKGQLDYGPYSLADVVAQIEHGKVMGVHIIVDKDTGARAEVGSHPILGPISDAAKARMDEHRRVAAETSHRRTESKRSLLLYALIAMAVVAVAGGSWWGITRVRNDETTSVAAVTGVGSATIDINVSAPKRPARAARSANRGNGASSASATGDDLALDFSDDDDASETLDLATIHKVYSRQGGALGRCLSQNGGGTATISFIIDGRSGRVTVVRVNGKNTGGLSTCIGKVMRSLSFPPVNGPRTRAEFDISM